MRFLGLHRLYALMALPICRWHFARLHPLAPAPLLRKRMLRIHHLERLSCEP